jgi:molybdopterin-synthase adenylyltransferase
VDTNRQNSIVDPSIISAQHPLVIGVGAVGRSVAETLTCNGVPRLSFCDFDIVEEHNKSTQGFLHDDIGKQKVDAVAEHCLRINPDLDITVVNDRFRPKHFEAINAKYPVTGVFNCVDSLALRFTFFKFLNKKFPDLPIFDARIGGEMIRVVSVTDEDSRKYYPQTITPDADAYSNGCHIPMIKHSATMGACHIVQQYMAAISGKPVYTDRFFSLLGNFNIDKYEEFVNAQND